MATSTDKLEISSLTAFTLVEVNNIIRDNFHNLEFHSELDLDKEQLDLVCKNLITNFRLRAWMKQESENDNGGEHEQETG